jgi:endonuclease/exonuclease/phosphatase family metal-dependent hydrolase
MSSPPRQLSFPWSRPARGGDLHYGVAEPPARPAGAVRIVSYNVENLFPDAGASGVEKPEEHCRALAAVIGRLDADVLCLQEVTSRGALESFRDAWLAGLGYAHVASLAAGDDRCIEQSVLSRHPVVAAANWPRLQLAGLHPADTSAMEERHAGLAGTPIRYHRSPLRVDLTIAGAALTVFVVHQKAGRPCGYWRDAEAAATARRAAELLRAAPDARVVVLGDFNAEPGDGALAPYAAAGFVDLLAQAGTPYARTLATHATGRRIDHAFVSPALARAVVGRAFVLGTPVRAPGADKSLPLPPGYASDHFPVCFDVRLAEPR